MVDDLTGKTFGQLTVQRRGPNKGAHAGWVCVCTCGAKKVVAGNELKKGSTLSCGCHRSKRMAGMNETHGMANTSEYRSWCAMWNRCSNPNSHNYKRYAARGISVCKRWAKFENFFADMGPRPEGCTLERVNNDKGYSKANCVWATLRQQQNNIRTNRRVTWKGRTMTVAEWARELGINYQTLSWRLRNGWSVGRALGKTVHFEV